ncbi:unnamed protein product [Ceutorhynchus assimilis]|uniref:RING-type domain-containing protein n=1 Tax=Ceutorhynchus assimilis TaxID=467358 RepID=A0A9N9MAQ2_9CUCU|nr:unnamed protein product [Ceutorhynchus assimilis]
MMSNIKSLMEDLKCNKCLINTKCVQQIFLFECGHMICQRCEKMIVRRQFCHVCKKTARMMELPKENMHPIMEMMFWPFDNVVTQTIRVMNFKMAQEATALRDLMQNYKAAKGSAVTYRLEHEALMEEARTLTEKLIAQGKPVPSVNNHLDDQSVSDGSSIRCAASLCGSTPGTARTDDPKDVSGELSRTGRIEYYVFTETRFIYYGYIQKMDLGLEENSDIILNQAAEVSADLLPVKFSSRYGYGYHLFTEWQQIIKIVSDYIFTFSSFFRDIQIYETVYYEIDSSW